MADAEVEEDQKRKCSQRILSFLAANPPINELVLLASYFINARVNSDNNTIMIVDILLKEITTQKAKDTTLQKDVQQVIGILLCQRQQTIILKR